MKLIVLSYKKIIFNDMLAIALAGIISLLFAQTSYVFLNDSMRKLEYRSVTADYKLDRNCTDEFYLVQADYNLSSPAEEIDFIQVNATNLSIRQCLRIIFQSRVYEQLVVFKKIFYLSKYLQSARPIKSSPSIPIAFCKLII